MSTFTPSPVNLSSGLWQEDDLDARNVIRAMYRRRRRNGHSRTDARDEARCAAITLADYQGRKLS